MEGQVATQKQYPFEEEDKKFEEQIIEAIKKLPLEQRIQAIALNTYLLAKKQADSRLGDQVESIDAKYRKAQQPLEKKINEVIAGERELAPEEIEYAKTNLTTEEVAQIDQNATKEPIQEYWFKVLTSCVRFENDIFETDHPLLKKITKIESVTEDNGLNFTLVFHFDANDYFENSTLSVKFYVSKEDEVPEKIEGTDIKWKEGKDITSKTITKKKKNKKTGKKVNVTKVVEADSFFNLFKSVESSNDDGEDEEDEEANLEMQKLQDRYDVAMTIQEEILMYHLEYYLGLRKGDEDYDMPDEEFDDDEDDEVGGIPKALKKKLGLLGKK